MLSTKHQNHLVDIADYEIKHHLCTDVPKYQSFNNMHVKYKDDEALTILCDLILLNAYTLTNMHTKIKTCWFNVLKEDSLYVKHKHDTLACVYYLKNCTGNGTVVFIKDTEKMLPCLDNTIQFISSDVYHKVPNYNGLDRYSIAFDLCSA
jgi:hypothetical protein